MKEDVSVRVCGVQRCPGAEEDVSELVCEGVFKHTADAVGEAVLAHLLPVRRVGIGPVAAEDHGPPPRRGAQRDDLRGGRVPYHIL